MTNYCLFHPNFFGFLRDLLLDSGWLWNLQHRILVDLIPEMLLDGLFIDLLKLLPIFAVQEDGIAIIEFGLRQWGLDEHVKNVLTVSLRIR